MLADAKWSADRLLESVCTLMESIAARLDRLESPAMCLHIVVFLRCTQGQLFLEWIDTVRLHGRRVPWPSK